MQTLLLPVVDFSAFISVLTWAFHMPKEQSGDLTQQSVHLECMKAWVQYLLTP